MYRLIMYYLLGLLGVAAVLSLFGIMPFSIAALACSVLVVGVTCLLINMLFAEAFEVPVNVESAYITALILVLIITPPAPFDVAGFWFLVWASVWAMASKYIFALDKKHIFNPAAFGVVVTALVLNQSASWWVGTVAMLPFVLIGGFLMARKIHRFDLVISFVIAVFFSCVVSSAIQHKDAIMMFKSAVFDTPVFFFAFVMLTEPLTTPPTKWLRIAYAGLVGFLFTPFMHVGSLYSTPELALLVGTIFSWAVSPKGKYLLTFKEKKEVGQDTYNFIFTPNRKVQFEPGQYFEWTLGYKNPDNRGNRRYFTIASSPTEDTVQLGVKFYPNMSTYKQAMLKMKPGDVMLNSQLAGDFLLPQDKEKKLVFIAGGIGITPFRSMIKYLIDTDDKRAVTLFYCNKTVPEIAYKDVFDEAEKKIGMKAVYTLTDMNSCPVGWKGCKGFITPEMIQKEVPDFAERLFYISGPHGMVVGYEEMLRKVGVKQQNIVTDFFPGF